MTAPAARRIWGRPEPEIRLIGRNITTRYLAIAVDGLIGLLLLPYNISHLGPSAYGLWALTASVTVYFSAMDLGYGGALVKFVAQYRAWRNRQALNEILSTMFVVFGAAGFAVFAVLLVLASHFDQVFRVGAQDVGTGRTVLLIIGCFIAVRFPLNIFGAVVYGFQQYHRNNLVSILSSVAAAAVNVLVLQNGFGLIELVAATTAVRVLALGGFVWNAYVAFPGLHVSVRQFRRARLKEVTGFSVYVLVLDWSAKLNYSADAIVIGMMIGTAPVAIWTVGQRLAQVTQKLTNQLTAALFPNVVDSDAGQRPDRLRLILIQGTRLSMALAVPACTGLTVFADRVVTAWVGPSYRTGAIVAQILLTVVLIRVSTGTGNMILRGTGRHRLLAFTNAGTAVVNVLLSVALAPTLGLVGVALGTLIPVGAAAAFVLLPAACRRVGLQIRQLLQHSVWPALWPAAGMGAVLWMGEWFHPHRLHSIGIVLVFAGLVYEMLFLMGLPTDQRRLYWSKLVLVLGRPRRLAAAA